MIRFGVFFFFFFGTFILRFLQEKKLFFMILTYFQFSEQFTKTRHIYSAAEGNKFLRLTTQRAWGTRNGDRGRKDKISNAII